MRDERSAPVGLAEIGRDVRSCGDAYGVRLRKGDGTEVAERSGGPALCGLSSGDQR